MVFNEKIKISMSKRSNAGLEFLYHRRACARSRSLGDANTPDAEIRLVAMRMSQGAGKPHSIL